MLDGILALAGLKVPKPLEVPKDDHRLLTKKTEISYNRINQRTADNRRLPTPAIVFQNQVETFHGKNVRDSHQEEHQDSLSDDDELDGSGTVVIRSTRRPQPRAQSNLSSGNFEDASISGTVVFSGQNDDSDSPRAPRSMLGIQERTSSASHEKSAANLAEAKAAIQGGLRKANARERSAPSKYNNDGHENKREKRVNSSDSSRSSPEYFDAQKGFAQSSQTIDDEESARIVSSSGPLSLLLIPSFKEAVGDDSERLVVRAVTNSQADMERLKPGSGDLLVRSLLQRLSSSKESSMKDLQELAGHLFAKGKATFQETPNAHTEADRRNKLQNRELTSNANTSPLARVLLSRWQSQV